MLDQLPIRKGKNQTEAKFPFPIDYAYVLYGAILLLGYVRFPDLALGWKTAPIVLTLYKESA